MARRKTKGDPITLRLPLHADSYIRARAAANGKEPGQHIADQLTASVPKAPE